MKIKLLAGAALAAVFTASGASAQPINGWYGALDLGYHRPEGIEATSSNAAPDGRPYSWTFAHEDSWTGFARLGYRLNPNWRIELEGGYRPGDIESVRGDGARFPGAPIGLCTQGVTRTAAAPNCGSPEGSVESWTMMANLLFDFMPAESPFRPFVGFGVGINRVDMSVIGQFSNVGTITAANPRFQDLVINDEDLTFAYQGIAGVAWAMSERLAIDLTYRYLAGAEVDFDSQGSAPNGLQPGRFSGEYEDQSLTLGLRYAFAPPPPPPEPAPEPLPLPPPPEPAPLPPPPPEPVVERPVMREFVVYFPFDQSILTPEAQTVVQEAASYAQQGNATQVQVVGHADTSGSAAYNVRLSERRARAVADSMVGLGVNPGVITADWRGETQPAVQTGDSVREPLNRRATINVNF